MTPSLLAVPLPLLPDAPARSLLVQSLAGCLVVDGLFTRRGLLPNWYFRGLRIPLTLVACGSLIAAAAPAPEPKPAPPAQPAPAAPPKPAAPPALPASSTRPRGRLGW